MSIDGQLRFRAKILVEIQDLEKKLEVHRAMLELFDHLEDESEDEDKDETEYVLPPVAMPDSQLPPPESGRFADASQDEATETILKEFAPGALHYRNIAKLAVRNGYGNGKKTAKSVKNSFASACHRLTVDNKIERVGRGMYRIAHSNGNGQGS